MSSSNERIRDTPRLPISRFQEVLSASSREEAHALLGQMSLLVGIFESYEPWIAAILRLRESCAISANESFYFLGFFIESVIGEVLDTDPTLVQLSRRAKSIASDHGKDEDEPWPDAPAEYRDLDVQWLRRTDEIKATYWRRVGANDAADQIERSSADFSASRKQGRVEFDRRWPPDIGGE